jgi:hypothetical protein
MTYRLDPSECAISATPLLAPIDTASHERLRHCAFLWLTLAAIVLLAIGFVFWHYSEILWIPRPPRGQEALAVRRIADNVPARWLLTAAFFSFVSDIALFLTSLGFSIAFLARNSGRRSNPPTILMAAAAVALLVSVFGALSSLFFTFFALFLTLFI